MLDWFSASLEPKFNSFPRRLALSPPFLAGLDHRPSQSRRKWKTCREGLRDQGHSEEGGWRVVQRWTVFGRKQLKRKVLVKEQEGRQPSRSQQLKQKKQTESCSQRESRNTSNWSQCDKSPINPPQCWCQLDPVNLSQWRIQIQKKMKMKKS